MSVSLKVDGIPVTVPEGSRVIEAARAAGIEVPSLCSLSGHPPRVSCGLCVMEDARSGGLFPSCALRAEDGMEAAFHSPAALAARKAAAEILLSEHSGDCRAPCSRACPAGLDAMRAVRLYEAGDLRASIAATLEILPFPGLMAVSCAGYCEKACRRGLLDSPIPIREMHAALARAFSMEERAGMIGGAPHPLGPVTVDGGGPAALSAAFFLLRAGCAAVISGDRPSLIGAAPAAARGALEGEIAVLTAAGCVFGSGSGKGARAGEPVLRLEAAGDGWKIPAREISRGRMAALSFIEGGAAARPTAGVARESSAAGGGARGSGVSGDEREARGFQSMIDDITSEELEALAASIGPAPRSAAGGPRCLSCGCGKSSDCRLREIAAATGADRRRFPGARIPVRRTRLSFAAGALIVEPGKCVKCGICVRLSARTPFPLSFMGRGFALEAGGFEAYRDDRSMECARAFAEIAARCPTGALVWEGARA